jgi:hypothetical protein
VTGGCRKLHNEELHDLYSSPNTIRIIKITRMSWTGHVTRMGNRDAYRILMGEIEGNGPLGRPKRRCVNLGAVEWGGLNWTDLAQDG